MKKNYFSRILLLLFVLPILSQAQDGVAEKQMNKGSIVHASFKADSLPAFSNAPLMLQKILNVQPGNELRLEKTRTDNKGIAHQYYSQYYNGYPVAFSLYGVHGKNGKISTMNGGYTNIGKIDLSIRFSEKEALLKAQQFINAKEYAATPKADLVICKDYIKTNRRYYLTYQFKVNSIAPHGSDIVFVDALSGEVVHRLNQLCHINPPGNTTGTADTRYSGTGVSLTTDSYGGGYRLQEVRNSVNIYTYNSQKGTSYSTVDFSDADNNWTSGEYNNGNKDNAALDAHWGIERILDYWYNERGRNSVDDAGSPVYQYVHFDNNYDNAFYDWGADAIAFGDGNTRFHPLTSLDLIAHEFSHGITNWCVKNNTALNGSNGGINSVLQIAALDEGMSDAWASIISYWNDPLAGDVNWKICDQIMANGYSCLRSLISPKTQGHQIGAGSEGGYPDTYVGTYYSNLDINPHTNSTIASHCIYLLINGGSGTNDNSQSYNISGIGVDKAAAILYQYEKYYLTPEAEFLDARAGMIDAATDLFGACSPEVMQVQNAWYAVGRGSAAATTGSYSITGDDLICTNEQYTINSLPGGSTITWSVCLPEFGSLNSVSANPVTLTKTDNGIVDLCAAVDITGTGCRLIKKSAIVIGSPRDIDYSLNINSSINNPFCTNSDGNIASVYPQSFRGDVNFEWGYVDLYGSPTPTVVNSAGSVDQDFYFSSPSTYQVYAKAQNVCGYLEQNIVTLNLGVSDECNGFRMQNNEAFKVSPNPSSNDVAVTLTDKNATIRSIIIKDKMGNIHKQFTYKVKSNTTMINVSSLPAGVYFVQVFDGSKWMAKSILKN